jgi:hypothetical protein
VLIQQAFGVTLPGPTPTCAENAILLLYDLYLLFMQFKIFFEWSEAQHAVSLFISFIQQVLSRILGH